MKTISRAIAAAIHPLNDTLLLILFAVCWLGAVFPRLPEPVGVAVAGRVASALAMTMVFINWTFRPELRPGWRRRDLWLLGLVLLTAFQAHAAPIRQAAMLDLLEMLELASIFIVALYLTIHRPQPFFIITLLLLAFTTALAAGAGRDSVFAYLDTVALAEIAFVMALAMLPWLAPRYVLPYRKYYLWIVLGSIGLIVILEAAGVTREQGGWLRWINLSFPEATRRFLAHALRHAGIFGLGPDHYDWFFRANVSEDFISRTAPLPGFIILLIERGLIGLVGVVGFAAAVLWRPRPGLWARDRADALEMAQPLRAATAFAWVLFLATPALRSGFGFVMLWTFTGMARAWSARRPIAAVALLGGQSPEAGRAAPLFSRRLWSARESFLVMAAFLAIVGLTFLHVAPFIAAWLVRRPSAIKNISDPAYSDRLELARFFWPYDPLIHRMAGANIRGKADLGVPLTPYDLDAVTQAFQRMILANPYDPLNHQTLADWYVRLGRPNDEIETYRRSLLYAPASLELRYHLAKTYRKTGRNDLAVQTLLEARDWYPNSVQLLAELADIERARGNSAEAEYYLNLARQLER